MFSPTRLPMMSPPLATSATIMAPQARVYQASAEYTVLALTWKLQQRKVTVKQL
jgi:hypothetical protein